MPIDDTTTKKFTVNRDGTWSESGQDGHVFLKTNTGTLDFRTGDQPGIVCDRANWVEMNCKAGDKNVLATRLHGKRATNGNLKGD